MQIKCEEFNDYCRNVKVYYPDQSKSNNVLFLFLEEQEKIAYTYVYFLAGNETYFFEDPERTGINVMLFRVSWREHNVFEQHTDQDHHWEKRENAHEEEPELDGEPLQIIKQPFFLNKSRAKSMPLTLELGEVERYEFLYIYVWNVENRGSDGRIFCVKEDFEDVESK